MPNPVELKWKAVCERVASYDDVDSVQFSALMERVFPQALSDGFLLVTVDNAFLKNWIEKNFLNNIHTALEEIYRMPFSVVIEVDDSEESPTNTVIKNPAVQGQNNSESSFIKDYSTSLNATQNDKVESYLNQSNDHTAQDVRHSNSSQNVNIASDYKDPLASSYSPVSSNFDIKKHSNFDTEKNARTNPVSIPTEDQSTAFKTLTFENFVRGDSNRMAYSMAVQVAENPGSSMLNPLFIYGKSGLGKTHLMRAIQNYINDTQPYLRTVYEDTDNFVSGYVNATIDHTREKDSYQNFIQKYQEADVLLIDDVQFLQGKEGTIEIIFQIFNQLMSQGKQIILSADREPKNILIDERYTSRFAQGGNIDIQPPEVETKLAIVKLYISEYQKTDIYKDVSIPEDIQMYIAENSGSNIRELKSAVTHLIMHINLLDKPDITLSEAKDLLESHFSHGLLRNLTIDDIQNEVENFYRIKHSDLVGSSRSRDIVVPRQMAMYLCRQMLDDPFQTIAKKFNRDHSTVMHSVAKIEKDIVTNRNLQEELEILQKKINAL